ncbi:molybdopterin cofactor-binding domain-containing protein [Nocardia crassostreae]|uniref:molybdopterin cofactor-binding domain-containing protein n=1 Tax=Nocardia crassostreae TaxID=53428 RepID=UPI00082C7A9A|nr:molybdopterin cofactor-binding domain-containing protein [Nocardia crassostreae]
MTTTRIARTARFPHAVVAIRYSGGTEDFATARVRLAVVDGEPVVVEEISDARRPVAVAAQIARTELGIDQVLVHPADSATRDLSSSVDGRQTFMTGGAVTGACEAVRRRVLAMTAGRHGPYRGMKLVGGRVVSATGMVLATIADILGDEVVEETRTYIWQNRRKYR